MLAIVGKLEAHSDDLTWSSDWSFKAEILLIEQLWILAWMQKALDFFARKFSMKKQWPRDVVLDYT